MVSLPLSRSGQLRAPLERGPLVLVAIVGQLRRSPERGSAGRADPLTGGRATRPPPCIGALWEGNQGNLGPDLRR